MAETRKTSCSSQQHHHHQSPKKQESKDGGGGISGETILGATGSSTPSSSKKISSKSPDAAANRTKKSSKNVSAHNRRRRKRKEEEEYTDKDRAAAVNLWSWSRDIKHSLKMAQRNREMQQRLLSSDPTAVGDLLAQTEDDFLAAMFIAEATHEIRIKKDVKAGIPTLDKALDLCPGHKGALVARSKCFLKLGNAVSALRDAENCFDHDDGNDSDGNCGNENQANVDIMGLYEYAEALYNLGQFEAALIAYHRGFRVKNKGAAFRIGIQKTEEAIQRAIGDGATKRLRVVEKILQQFGKKGDKINLEVPTPVTVAPPTKDGGDTFSQNRGISGGKLLGSFVNLVVLGNRDERQQQFFREKLESLRQKGAAGGGSKKSNKSKSTANRRKWGGAEKEGEMLGRMYQDKKFLTKLIKRLDTQAHDEDRVSQELRCHAQEGLHYLKVREQFWRQQNPSYSRNSR